MPKLAFALLAGGLAMVARKLPANPVEEVEAVPFKKGEKGKEADATPGGENLAGLLKMDELTLEIGFQLIPLVDEKQGGQMLNRVRSLRRHLATELGFVVPPVHITDNLRLKPREYTVSLRGIEIARWQTEANCVLAVNSDPKARKLPGIEVREPAFGVAAKWIQRGLEDQALAAGYSVVDQTSVIGTHLGEVIRRHAYELLGRQETKRLLDTMNESHPKLVEELVPKLLTLGEVQKVLQQLLREQVSIRDMGSILEALVEAAAINKNPISLVEAARHALGRALIRPLLDDSGQLKVVTLDRALEDECARTSTQSGQLAGGGALQISVANRVMNGLRAMLGDQVTMAPPILLCSSPGRFYLRRVLEPFIPKIVVISPSEIPPMTQVQSLGSVR